MNLNYNSSLLTSEEFVPRIVYLFLVAISTVFGNLLVIVAVARFRKLRRSTNLLLASLAAADLMSGIVTVPLYILWTVNPEVFDESGFLCRFVLLSCLLLVAASQLSLVVLSFERYLAVCQPFRHRSLILHCPWIHKVVIFFIWLISGIATAMSSLAIKSDYSTCNYYGVFDKMFLFLAVIFGVLVMFLAIIVMNIRVLWSVREHEKQLSVVEIAANSGDHRNSSYLCHQDAIESAQGPGNVVKKRINSSPSPKNNKNKKPAFEDETTQTLIKETGNEISSVVRGDVNSDDDDNYDDVTQIAKILSTNKSWKRKKVTSLQEKHNLRITTPLLEGEKGSESSNILSENPEIWGAYTEDVNANRKELKTADAFYQKDGEAFTSVHPKSVDSNLENTQNSLNDLNNPRSTLKKLSSIECLFNSEWPLKENISPKKAPDCIFNVLSDTLLTRKQLINTDSIIVEKPSKRCFTDTLENSLNEHQSFEQNFQIRLDSANKVDSTINLNKEQRSPEDNLQIIPQSALCDLKDNSTSESLAQANNDQDPVVGETTGNKNKKQRKLAKCHPENFVTSHVGWTKDASRKAQKQLNKNPKGEIVPYVKAKCDLFFNLPFLVSPSLRLPLEELTSTSNSCGRLQYLHLETSQSLQNKDNFSVDKESDPTIRQSPHGVSLQNVSSIPFAVSVISDKNNVSDQEDKDESDTVDGLFDARDNYPLLNNPTKSHTKRFNNNHIDKEKRKCAKHTQRHRSSIDISTKSPEESAQASHDLFQSVPSFPNHILRHKGVSVQETTSQLNLNTLPAVQFPIYRSCPGLSSDTVQSKTNVAGFEIPSQDCHDIISQDTIVENSWRRNVPCSNSPEQNSADFCSQNVTGDLSKTTNCQLNKADYLPNEQQPDVILNESDKNTNDTEIFKSDGQTVNDISLRPNQKESSHHTNSCTNIISDDFHRGSVNSVCSNNKDNNNKFNLNQSSTTSGRSSTSSSDNTMLTATSTTKTNTTTTTVTNNNSNKENYYGICNKKNSIITSNSIVNINDNEQQQHKQQQQQQQHHQQHQQQQKRFSKKSSTVSNRSSVSCYPGNAITSYNPDLPRKSISVSVGNNKRQAYISKKVARTVTLVCCSFILAWLPFFVAIIYNTFCASCNLDYALNAVLMVAFGQSACNPIIYALCHASFRRAYESLLTQLCSKASRLVGCRSSCPCLRRQHDPLDFE